MTFRPMPVLTVLTLVCLAILVMLGNWQYARYSSKIAARTQAVVVADASLVEVRVDRTNTGMAQLVYGTLDGEPVWRRYVPGHLVDDGRLVLLALDATGGPQPVPLAIDGLDALPTRRGILVEVTATRGAFAAKDQPEEDLWYSLDPAGMASNLGYADTPAGVVEPDWLTVRNSEDLSQARQARNTYASAEASDPLPPERHIGYALTWWGMAIGLMIVYLALHHSQGRLRFRRSS